TSFGEVHSVPQQSLNLETGIKFEGEAGSPPPLLSFGGGGLSGTEDTINHIEIATRGSALEIQGGSADGVIAHTSGENAVACNRKGQNRSRSGLPRNRACISTGKGATAVSAGLFSEAGGAGNTIEPKLRGVTAVSTGAQSVGLRATVESLGPTVAQDNVN